MNKWFLWLVGLFVIALALAGCRSTEPVTEPQVVVESADDVQRITPSDAKALLDGGDAVLYDSRSEAAYQQVHAAGALSLPASEAAARFSEFPAGKSLIFYCT